MLFSRERSRGLGQRDEGRGGIGAISTQERKSYLWERKYEKRKAKNCMIVSGNMAGSRTGKMVNAYWTRRQKKRLLLFVFLTHWDVEDDMQHS